MTNTVNISVAIIAQNEEKNIQRCLKSLGFAREIVVVDAHSTDRTVDIARTHNARVLQSQADRLFIQSVTGGEPTWAFKLRPDDDRRYVRKAGAVQTKAKARYPFIAPPPIR